jgi:hypothetical protein
MITDKIENIGTDVLMDAAATDANTTVLKWNLTEEFIKMPFYGQKNPCDSYYPIEISNRIF